MSKLLPSLLDSRQFLIGFDPLFRELDRQLNNTQTKYPPHDIIKTSEHTYQIVLAIAGFKRSDVEISLDGSSLVITGSKKRLDDEKLDYIYNGISHRAFRREFTLRDNVVVRSAKVDDGLLTIELEEVIPEEKKPRLIQIQ
jgi:molecular chaperone IbpA